MAYENNFFTNMLPNQHFDATLTFTKVGFNNYTINGDSYEGPDANKIVSISGKSDSTGRFYELKLNIKTSSGNYYLVECEGIHPPHFPGFRTLDAKVHMQHESRNWSEDRWNEVLSDPDFDHNSFSSIRNAYSPRYTTSLHTMGFSGSSSFSRDASAYTVKMRIYFPDANSMETPEEWL
jgi:hypothetical protein